MQGFLTEFGKIVNALPPVVQNGAAKNSLYVCMQNYQRCTFIVVTGDRAGSTTPDITLTQASASDGTGAKAVSFDEAWKSTTQSQSNDVFAAATVTSDAVALLAGDNSVHVINVHDTMLDVANGFEWVRCNVATPGANDVPIAIIAILYDGDYSGKPTTLPSVVAATGA